MTSNTQKKPIVLLCDCLADLGGGAEKQIYELAKGLDKKKYDVFVISMDCWGKAPKGIIEATGCQLHIFKVTRIYGLSGLKEGIRFYNFLKKNKIDTILTYHFSSDIWGTVWGRLAQVKTIISNRRDMGFWRKWVHVQAYKCINRFVNKIVVVSTPIKEMIIEKEHYPANRIEVIYNGVHFEEKFKEVSLELKQSIGLSADDLVIMHVANLKPVKGHKFLIEAFASLHAQYPAVRLVLIGRDDLNGEIQSLARRFGILNKVLFLGQRRDVKDLLKIADICVLPSLSEGMSNSILEYMAAAKPVVATRVGGNPELVRDGYNGLLVDKEQYKQLENALIRLINDPDSRRQMGINGYARVKNEFYIPSMIERYDLLFNDIRVLHLISSGGLYGAERVILNLAAQDNGVKATVGAIRNAHNPHLEIIDEAKNLKIDTVVFDSNGKIDLKTISNVKKFIIDNDIDVLHTHNYKSDLIGFSAVQGTRAKWVATQHGWINTDQKLKMYENLDAQILKFSKKLIVLTWESCERFKNNNFKDGHVQIIDNGIPVERFKGERSERLRTNLGVKSNDFAVAIVGRLADEKGHEIFLKAATILKKNIQNMKFLIVGDGPLRPVLQQMVLDLGLSEQVIFTGIRQDMPNIYASVDMLVNASYIEGLPMTILEAMSARLPVVATDVGAVGTVIVDQESGILIKPGDPEALAAAILVLAQDLNKCQAFADKAYETVCSQYSDTLMAERYKQVYRSVL